MNDWEIKKFLKVVLAIQIALWGAIGLDAIGIQIPIIRPFIGFVYLTFVPGIIILRILKLHKLGNIETILYAVGLSIATLMFTGLFMNTIYPFLGISEPISNIPLIITISAVVLILCVLCYARDRNFSEPVFINVRDILSPPALFLCLIPFLAVFGTYLVNFHQNNTLLMFMIVVISAVVILIGFDKFIPKKLYPLAVLAISISLLFHNSLISKYIWGWDIHYEYYISNFVITNSRWDSTIYTSVNAMLSIVMFAPIFSDISGMSLTWVFKIVYPLLFTLVPLGLYRMLQKQTNDKIAFLACFFFVSIAIFYTEMLALARQQIAELFFVLLILLMIDKDMNKVNRSILFIMFGISLIVSHYGLSYIYMAVLIFAWMLLVLFETTEMQKLVSVFYFKFNIHTNGKTPGNPTPTKITNRSLSITYVLLFIVFTLTWYMYVSNSYAFNIIVQIGDHIASSIYEDFLNPETAQGLIIMISETKPTVLSQLNRIINYLNQIFIIIGVLVLLKPKKMKFEKEYIAFSMINLVILLSGVSVPFFASALNMTRLYHITLIVLEVFGVIGGIKILIVLSTIVRAPWKNRIVKSTLKILSIYFVIFFLYQVGFVYGVAEGRFYSISLNSTDDHPRFNEQEFLGAKWLSGVKNSNPIYADEYRWLLLGSFEWGQARCFSVDVDRIPKDSYIYFGTLNVMKDEVIVRYTKGVTHTMGYINSEDIIDGRNKIYANGGAQVYYR